MTTSYRRTNERLGTCETPIFCAVPKTCSSLSHHKLVVETHELLWPLYKVNCYIHICVLRSPPWHQDLRFPVWVIAWPIDIGRVIPFRNDGLFSNKYEIPLALFPLHIAEVRSLDLSVTCLYPLLTHLSEQNEPPGTGSPQQLPNSLPSSSLQLT